ncbi:MULTISPECIES: coproporphyrinogen III oxidase [unclassified Amycolatopsis]|uniref:coproporphyrinogen III oxidase n=1 Tax=unclassified Amycolatopsis TaxID=2618356 RepID=UPI002874F922|nr:MULTISPECIES: coproporphyrinogen III oxidase [unclassified Amycolatopsis]MDS0138630.1 coproporphyrinogen III oxidase [Amycolatopsis sp. 505]MDS0146093.1 coproporphyrinogen III oxidase [Amycolatopsis sp. CM201R]
MPSGDRRDAVKAIFSAGQRELVAELERLDGGRFGRSGRTRLLENGDVFERAVVSAAFSDEYFAAGLSVVLHPRNPYVPAFQAHFRYREAAEAWWFGGSVDLLPCYGFAADATHFHRVLKSHCDTLDPAFHAQAKRACDDRFRLPHRNEARGIGGILFDHLSLPGPDGWRRSAAFTAAGIAAVNPAYFPIVHRRKDVPYGERERQWQLHRRGRYVEFTLVNDAAQADADALLTALPPSARWESEFAPEPGSAEAELASFLVPRDWAAETVGARR